MRVDTWGHPLPDVAVLLHGGHGGTALSFGTLVWAFALLLVLVGVLWYTGLLDAVRGSFVAGDDER